MLFYLLFYIVFLTYVALWMMPACRADFVHNLILVVRSQSLLKIIVFNSLLFNSIQWAYSLSYKYNCTYEYTGTPTLYARELLVQHKNGKELHL